MANPLQRASTRRKVYYLAAIVGLFTVSLLWRGKVHLPGQEALAAAELQRRLGGPAQEGEPERSFAGRAAGWLAAAPIAEQARVLELRELDQGDPALAGSVAQVSLVGSRGFVVTGLWWAAIEKQKRHEWHEFEVLVRLVTELQPHFVTPWIFQSWNIAYNVSVENDRLGDMFFYIARGIELLAKGDSRNTKLYVSPKDGERREVGSPDIRYQIAFYYQNKFGVSDKVQTLRSLMQLSVIPPADRDPLRFGPRDQPIDRAGYFAEFCRKHPQLVRRLRAKLNCERPEDVVQFLAENQRVPCRYTTAGELAAPADQFPVLPPEGFVGGDAEYGPTQRLIPDDTFDAFHAARGWFKYSLAVVPPPKTGPDGRPLPWSSPKPGDFDEFKYRLPRSPAYIIFRQQAPRAQTYLAERLAKEGWFDDTSYWDPDERGTAGNLWLKDSEAAPAVKLTSRGSSEAEYRLAYQMWRAHGAENALRLTGQEFENLRLQAGPLKEGDLNSLPPEYTPAQLEEYGITPQNLEVRKALTYYNQNRSMTNFPYFLASTEAEADPLTVTARKTLFAAEQAEQAADPRAAIRLYIDGLDLWRQALVKFPEFHRPERAEQTEETTYEMELNLIRLLREDGSTRRRAEAVLAADADAHRAAAPGLPEALAGKLFDQVLDRVAEREAGVRVALRSQEVRAKADQLATPAAALAPAAAAAPAVRDGLDRAALEAHYPWLPTQKEVGVPWVREDVKRIVLGRNGLTRTGQELPPGAAPPDDGNPPSGQ